MKLSGKKRDKVRIQSAMAIASFSMGSIIACICLFVIDPLGEITNSALGIVSEFLCLSGGLLGISAAFNHKMKKFETSVNQKLIDENIDPVDISELED